MSAQPKLAKGYLIHPKPKSKEFFKELFLKLSQPLTSGQIDSNGVRYQKINGRRTEEHIFLLSEELTKVKPDVIYRTFDSQGAWALAICSLMGTTRGLKKPTAIIYCIQRDMVTCTEVNLNFDIVYTNLK